MYPLLLFFFISGIKGLSVVSTGNVLFDKVVVPAGCVIPRDVDNIARAALLQQCISPSKGKKLDEERCFGELGCFPMKSPWTSNLRPFPQPMTPDEIQPQLIFYSRDNPEVGQVVQVWPNISTNGLKFDPKRPYTTFMTHGFASNCNTTWIQHLKDNYLKQRDANVFLVDWNKGANLLNYLQVASNTRVVGAAVSRFVKYLREEKGVKPGQIHLIGHSLGSHISSYVAKSNPKISVLTALDPAQPGFEGSPAAVRLDKSDAEFVEVVHTSGRPFIPLLGFGFITTVGHVDFYFNGGALQPKCKIPPFDSVNITSISDLVLVPVEVLSEWVGCSHNLAHEYYSEAILTGNNNCSFVARKTGAVEHLSNTFSAGYANKLTNPILSRIGDCDAEKCSIFGLDIYRYPTIGKFTINTNSDPPFCLLEVDRQKSLAKAVSEREQNKASQTDSKSVNLTETSTGAPNATTTVKSILSPVKNVFSKVKSFI
ncbi:unnamed protein product [Bemisia tabaci]|uniref:Lipase domain-containing protein n=1 Tax=Bemisia tabaci TaxID=7038 RepID=A0A9N9ZZ62_BEMTA|nr:unnamed protein product [Bemisia tabaci]